MEAYEKALAIIRMDPLPDDYREQLDALEPDIPDFIFERIEEGLVLAEGEQKLIDSNLDPDFDDQLDI